MSRSCGQARGLAIGYARVPVADASQHLDPRPNALIGTGVSGRTEPLGGNEVTGSPEGPVIGAPGGVVRKRSPAGLRVLVAGSRGMRVPGMRKSMRIMAAGVREWAGLGCVQGRWLRHGEDIACVERVRVDERVEIGSEVEDAVADGPGGRCRRGTSCVSECRLRGIGWFVSFSI